MDSKGNLWAFQRNAPGRPQLFEFGPDHKLIHTVGEDVIGHQSRPMASPLIKTPMCGSAMQRLNRHEDKSRGQASAHHWYARPSW
jgi:hypothetical protein